MSNRQGYETDQLKWLGSNVARERINQQIQSQASLGAAMAIAMVVQEYGNWLDQRTDGLVAQRWEQMIESALAQCRERKKQAPPRMAECGGCCQITVFFRWQEPGERLWFGQYEAPSGRRYPTSSVGDYSVRNCSDRPNDYLVDNPEANGYQVIRVKL